MILYTSIKLDKKGLAGFIADAHSINNTHLARMDGQENINAYYALSRNIGNHEDLAVKIVYSEHLNICKTRFFICKEISHIFLKTDENLTRTNDEIISLIHEISTDPHFQESTQGGIAEEMAYISAIELLLPYQLLEKLSKLLNEGHSNKGIASVFRVPEKIIESRLNDSVIDLFNEVYQDGLNLPLVELDANYPRG